VSVEELPVDRVAITGYTTSASAGGDSHPAHPAKIAHKTRLSRFLHPHWVKFRIARRERPTQPHFLEVRHVGTPVPPLSQLGTAVARPFKRRRVRVVFPLRSVRPCLHRRQGQPRRADEDRRSWQGRPGTRVRTGHQCLTAGPLRARHCRGAAISAAPVHVSSGIASMQVHPPGDGSPAPGLLPPTTSASATAPRGSRRAPTVIPVARLYLWPAGGRYHETFSIQMRQAPPRRL
jgi:hypothetical protein